MLCALEYITSKFQIVNAGSSLGWICMTKLDFIIFKKLFAIVILKLRKSATQQSIQSTLVVLGCWACRSDRSDTRQYFYLRS